MREVYNLVIHLLGGIKLAKVIMVVLIPTKGVSKHSFALADSLSLS